VASTKITLKIIPFKNRSGNLSYRVSGMVLGTRIQKNFPTLGEAEGFMNGLVRTANQADSAKRERLTPTTFPTDEILRNAEAAYHLLQKHAPGTSLFAAVNSYLTAAGLLR
jgi:hypothetical protein